MGGTMPEYLKSLSLKQPSGASIIDPDEVQPLSEFKSRVSRSYPLPDAKLLAWLRARNLDVDRAEQMLRRHLIWRRNNETSKLIMWEPPKNYFPYFHSGFDKEGTPVFILPIGQWDLKGCVETGDMVPAMKFTFQTLETMVTAGSIVNIYQGIVILDFEGFTYSQIAHRTVIQGLIETVRVFEANYPEILKTGYVINAPLVFNIVYSIIKPLLHSRTLSKIQIFKSDPPKWKAALLQTIDPSQLPVHWGGSRPGTDNYCSTDWLTSPLPPYYFRSTSYYDDFGEDWTYLKISAGEVLCFNYVLLTSTVQKTLSWSFYTEGTSTDLDFYVVHSSTKNYLVESRRVVTSDLKKAQGHVTFREAGKYLVQFDNSWSNRSKILHHSLALTQSPD